MFVHQYYSTIFSRMFPNRIWYMLRFYDICGFSTETSTTSTNQRVFLLHILLACLLTLSIIILLTQLYDCVTTDILISVNTYIQLLSALSSYWMIIIESYLQKEAQRKLWKIFEGIPKIFEQRKRPNLFSYFIKFTEYLVVFTAIQIALVIYFILFFGGFFHYQIAYFILVKMYQTRIFYYVFYLELVKHELKTILNDLKCRIVSHQSVCSKDLKSAREYYQSICEIVHCINQIFGWSHFVTILFCVHLPLTDLNWAYLSIYERPTGYVPVFILWIIHLTFILIYLFYSADGCTVYVI